MRNLVRCDDNGDGDIGNCDCDVDDDVAATFEHPFEHLPSLVVSIICLIMVSN